MEVRGAVPDDAPSLARLHVDGWQTAYRGILPDEVLDALSVAAYEEGWRARLEKDASVLVAEVGGELTGFATHGQASDADLAPTTGELHGLYVAPAYWSRGVGGVLWQAVTERLVSAGYHDMVIWTFAANERSRRFYAARGCTIDPLGSIEREYHGVFVPVVRLRATLRR